MTVSICYIVIGTVLKHSLAKNKTEQNNNKNHPETLSHVCTTVAKPLFKKIVFFKRKEQMREKQDKKMVNFICLQFCNSLEYTYQTKSGFLKNN